MAGDNFQTRCVAALAGNGAVLLSLANFGASHASEPHVLWGVGTLMVPSSVGLWLAYLALGREEAMPTVARRFLLWSAAAFAVQIAGLMLALQTITVWR